MGTTGYGIGVDGGGTKTELVLIDDTGAVVAQHLAPGCNPSILGPEQARAVLLEALGQLPQAPVRCTQLYMAGSPDYWQEFARQLDDFGDVSAHDDSLPVL
jgi:N-acetylglucosamine kinase-like BadF-type ATPase